MINVGGKSAISDDPLKLAWLKAERDVTKNDISSLDKHAITFNGKALLILSLFVGFLAKSNDTSNFFATTLPPIPIQLNVAVFPNNSWTQFPFFSSLGFIAEKLDSENMQNTEVKITILFKNPNI